MNSQNHLRRILLFRSGAVGDTLLLLPFLKHLERVHSNPHFTLVGHVERMGLLATWLNSASVIDEDSNFSWLHVPDRRPPERIREVLSAQDWMIRFTSQPGKAAVENLRRWTGCKIEEIAALPPETFSEHVVFLPFRELGIDYGLGDLLEDLNRLSAKKESRHTKQEDRIVIFPGGGSEKKRWPKENWQRVLEWLTDKTESGVDIVIGPAEEPSDFVRLNVGPSRTRLLQGLSLKEISSLVTSARAFIGSDSGITHLAALCGVKTLALFGPTAPRFWGPLGAQASVVTPNCLADFPDWLNRPGQFAGGIPVDRIAVKLVLDWLRKANAE